MKSEFLLQGLENRKYSRSWERRQRQVSLDRREMSEGNYK